jgi:hypothetical protein
MTAPFHMSIYRFRALGDHTSLKCSMPRTRLVIADDAITLSWWIFKVVMQRSQIVSIRSHRYGFDIVLQGHTYKSVTFASYFQGDVVARELEKFKYL